MRSISICDRQHRSGGAPPRLKSSLMTSAFRMQAAFPAKNVSIAFAVDAYLTIARAGSVSLNRIPAFPKWFSAWVMPPPLLAAAG